MSFSTSSDSVLSASTSATTLTVSSCPLSTVPRNGVGQNHGWQIGLPSDGVRNENDAGTRPLFFSVSSRRTGCRYLGVSLLQHFRNSLDFSKVQVALNHVQTRAVHLV